MTATKAPKILRFAAAAAALLWATTACGGSPDTAAATDQTPGAGQAPDVSRNGGPDFPGAAGEIADIEGSTLQVQSQEAGQVAVSYTTKTTFTAEVAARASDLKVGDCVMVTGAGQDTGQGTFAATAVRITAAVNGSCTTGRGGSGPMPGQAPVRAASGPPTDLPSAGPSGGPSGFRTGGAFGKVTAVNASGFTVESSFPGQTDATTRDVTTSSATKWTDTVKAGASALEVGKCVVAQGTKDDTGAVTATSIAVSGKVDGQCGGAFGRFQGGKP